MNRRDRRRAAARNRRSRQPGYQHRLGGLNRLLTGKRGLYAAAIEHDPSCAIYHGLPCSCVPDITINIDGTVHTIDERGEVARKGRLS